MGILIYEHIFKVILNLPDDIIPRAERKNVMNVTLKDTYQLFINGEWRDAEGGKTIATTNPATGAHLANLAEGSEKDVDDAVKAARTAFASWRHSQPTERAAILNKIADIIDANADLLATVETMDNGKPIRETSNIDVPFAAEHFRYFAGAIIADEGKASVLQGRYLSLILREPIGVVGQIVPWNFPFLMAAWKLAPAIAAGDTVVFKPSSTTSLSMLVFTELIADVLPKGVLNVITGKGSTAGEYVKNHPGLDKLAFTGSTQVGRDIAEAAAKRLIPATLELGGKSANIIFDDADMDKALDGVQLGILFNQGQVCCAGSRIFVQESIYEEFVKKAVEKFKGLKVGNPLDQDTAMGSQINGGQMEKILKYIKIGTDEGAKVACGGERLTGGEYDKGAFMAPTLLVNVTNDMRVAQEEIFGPVGVVIPFKDADDVIRMANESAYGLGGGVFTQNITTALKVAREIETGRIWVNTYNQIPAGAPFGGYKESGIGRETHKMILDQYSQVKNIMIDLVDAPSGFYDADSADCCIVR